MMAVSSSGESGEAAMDVPEGGLWNCPRVPSYSRETQNMLQLMMREAHLTLRQQRQLKNVINKEGALPVIRHTGAVTSSSQPRIQAKAAGLSGRPQKRSAKMCRSGNSYEREMFRPSATRDLEKEKTRLQNILAVGEENPKPSPPRRSVPSGKGEPAGVDRFQEVVDEIRDRMNFLDEMSTLGQRKRYQNIIETEISQKIRELELMDPDVSSDTDSEAGSETPSDPAASPSPAC